MGRYVIEENVWNSQSSQWIGPVVNGNIHDQAGRPIVWNNSDLSSITPPTHPNNDADATDDTNAASDFSDPNGRTVAKLVRSGVHVKTTQIALVWGIFCQGEFSASSSLELKRGCKGAVSRHQPGGHRLQRPELEQQRSEGS